MMLAHRRLAIVAVVLLVAFLAAGYALRDRLAHVPVVGPLLTRAGQGPPAAAQKVWVCPMHPEVRSDAPGKCPKCGMDLVEEGAPGVAAVDAPAEAAAPGGDAGGGTMTASPTPARAGLTIDLRRQQLIGVRTATVERRPIAGTTRTVGLVRYDETRQADVNLKIEAYVRDLHVDYTGQYVKRGQPLFSVYSPDLLATQNEYLLALETRDQLRASQVDDARSYADRLASAARQRLTLWDLSDAEIERLERTRQPRDAVEFRSPASGYVIEKRVVQGQRVTPGESLYRIADLSVVWVEADVFEREMAFVKTGQRAVVTVDAWPGERFDGRITYVYPYVEQDTRTVKVRLELQNRHGRLKPGMFANVELSSSLGTGLVLPRDAVIDTGGEQFAFVALGDGHYEPRRIRTGQALEDVVQVVEGLAEGDVVASAATFFIDSESQLHAAMQGYQATPDPGAAAAGGVAAAAPSSRVQIALRTEPDPPRNGDNTFVVTITDADGRPVADADVRVRLYMPPMPSMNMPAMSADATLLPRGGGVYRGQGNVSMAGRWETTVTVTRNGERLGSRQFALVAR
jgi:RND family efflux transporter MFP subunit